MLSTEYLKGEMYYRVFRNQLASFKILKLPHENKRIIIVH